jgi:hypothetical protein
VGFCSARRLTRLLCQNLSESTSQIRSDPVIKYESLSQELLPEEQAVDPQGKD